MKTVFGALFFVMTLLALGQAQAVVPYEDPCQEKIELQSHMREKFEFCIAQHGDGTKKSQQIPSPCTEDLDRYTKATQEVKKCADGNQTIR